MITTVQKTANIKMKRIDNLLTQFIQLMASQKWMGWFWSFLILIACTWPGKDIPSAPVAGFDKVVHAGLFMGWAILFLCAYPSKMKPIIVSGIIYGMLLEIYQQLLPFDRTFDWWDALADAVGVILGWAIYRYVLKPISNACID